MDLRRSTKLRAPWLVETLKILILAATYFVTGKLGTLLAIPPGYATAIWAPSGIALVGILLFGNRVWPGIFLGSCLVNFPTTLQAVGSASLFKCFFVVISIGLGASLEALCGAFLIRSFIGFPNPLNDEKDVIYFLALGGPVSCIVNATVSSTTLALAGAIPWVDYTLTWVTWWIGDATGVIVLAPLLLIAFSSPKRAWLGRRLGVILPLVVTFTMVILLFVFSSAREQAQMQRQFQEKANNLYQGIQTRFANDLILLQVTRSFLENSPQMSRAIFHDFVQSLYSRFPGLAAVVWSPVGPDGVKAFPAYVEPPEAGESLKNINFWSNPLCRQAFNEAENSGKAVGTGALSLKPPGGEPYDFLIVLPVYESNSFLFTPSQRRAHFKGFVIGVFRIGEAVGSALIGLEQDGIDLRIVDDTDPTHSRLLYSRYWGESVIGKPFREESTPQLGTGVKWDSIFDIAGRRWSFYFYETQAYLIAHRSWHAWLVLAASLFFTGILGAFLLIVTGRTSRIEELVAQRTASLEASESKFRSVMQSAQEAVLITDQDGTIIACNQAVEKTFGYRESEVLWKSISFLLPKLFHDDSHQSISDQLFSLVNKIVEVESLKKNGISVSLELSLATWKIGEQTFFSGFLRDMTERQKIDQMKTDLVSFASHQLKTPVAEVKGLSENLLQGVAGNLTQKQAQYVRYMKDASTRNLRLISDLLNISKITTGTISTEINPVKLKAIVDRLIKDYGKLALNKGLTLHVNEVEDVFVRADEQKMLEAIRNVFENAVRATEKGGITITVRSDPPFGIVEIEDTGPGIPDSIRAKLFTKELILHGSPASDGSEGTGLGLYTAKNFMQLQHGDVTVTSTSGQGSKFIFTLPLA